MRIARRRAVGAPEEHFRAVGYRSHPRAGAWALAFAVAFGGAGTGRTTILHVPFPFASIQSAIQSSVSDDTVLVERGTYVESIDFLGREILVTSQYPFTGDSLDIGQTVITPGPVLNTPVARFTSGEGRAAKLAGLTITGGSGSAGGGIQCQDASPTLEDLWIVDNHAQSEGGGIYALGGAPLVNRCRIASNDAPGDGGGISTIYSQIEVRGCDIHDNRCGYRGAGLFCEDATMVIDGNRIVRNAVIGPSAYNGGGITSRNCDPMITNNLIAENNGADYGGGIFY